MLACNRTRCAKGEALSRKADRLSWESWNERMWADGGPIDPSPTVDHALEIECSRCLVKRVVSLAELPEATRHASTTLRPAWAAAISEGGKRPLRHCCSWRMDDGTLPRHPWCRS
jgi:hypothetical protein